MLVSLTVGKVDAGVAVLLTEDKRLIEFPSILLPPDISSGSIVDITVSRNHASETAAAKAFHSLQTTIFQTFGQRSPSAPVLRCRNATQTSVVLEWDPIDLATAELRSLSLYRNGAKAGNIPRPMEMTSTKISGLAVDTEYSFYLVLRTSAGTYTSERLAVRTHKMTDLTGITVTPGPMPSSLRSSLAETINRIGAKMIDTVRIDTTHFVCSEGKGEKWERASEMNIPIVVPEWVEACEREGRVVGVRGYYLNADPRLRQSGPGANASAPVGQQHGQRQQAQPSQRTVPQQQAPMQSPRTEVTPPTPERASATERPDGARDRDGSEDDAGSPPPSPPPKPHDKPEAKLDQEPQAPPEEGESNDSEGEAQGASSVKALEAGELKARRSSVENEGEEGFDDVAL